MALGQQQPEQVPAAAHVVVPEEVPAAAAVQGAPEQVQAVAIVNATIQRTTQGVAITQYVLWILAGSIVLLLIYLLVLDYQTSETVDEMYNRVFSAMSPSISSPEARKIGGALAIFEKLRQTPTPEFSNADSEQTAIAISSIVARFQVSAGDTTKLNQCVQAVRDRVRPQTPAPAGGTAAAAPAPAPVGGISAAAQAPVPVGGTSVAVQAPASGGGTRAAARGPASGGGTRAAARAPAPGGGTRTAAQAPEPVGSTRAAAAQAPAPVGGAPAPTPTQTVSVFADCTKILEVLQFTTGGPVDTERLGLMRDFIKDIHDNHQALRTFWISAAQLILVNVLLPLLTALIGFIFGRQTSQS